MPAHLPSFLQRGENHRQQSTASTSSLNTKSSGKIKFKGPAPACELFGMLTAMAAGKHAADIGAEDVDMPSEPATPATMTPSGSVSEAGSGQGGEPRRSDVTAASSVEDTVDGRSSTETAVDQWMDDTLHQTPRQRDILSARFTALSLSNLSPYGEPMLEVDGKPKARPALPHFASKITADPVEVGDTMSRPSSPTKLSAPATPAAPQRDEPLRSQGAKEGEPTDAEKIAAITEEFGPISTLFEGDEPERMLAESKGSLFKSIMMIGNLHLTTHRLLFHALLPPDSAFTPTGRNTSTDQDAALMSSAHQSDILYAGPITVHRTSPFKHSKRVWLELTAELITSYPSGDEAGRVRPMQSILMSSVHHLEPSDDAKPRDFYVVYEAIDGLRRSHFSVDTEQSAVQWRKAFQSALFRHARVKWRNQASKAAGAQPGGESLDSVLSDSWSTLRCCLPLDRVTIRGIGDYHGFATLAGLDVNLGDQRSLIWSTEGGYPATEGDFAAGAVTRDGFSSPTRTSSISLKSALPLPFLKRSGSGSRDASPNRLASTSGVGAGAGSGFTSPLRRETTVAQSAFPPTVQPEALFESKARYTADGRRAHDEHLMTFNVAVLNEQAWFAEALEAATRAAAERKYKSDAAPSRSVINVAGFDCLATDEELEARHVPSSSSSSDAEGEAGAAAAAAAAAADEEEDLHDKGWAKETSKAAKISMAAKVFGLKEEEGVYIKRCYVATGVVPARGHIIITPKYICFWRRAVVGADIKYRFRTDDVKGAHAAPGIRAAFHGMALQIHGQHDAKFEFWKEASREEVLRKINDVLLVHSTAAAQAHAQTTQAAAARTPVSSPPQSPGFSTPPTSPGDFSSLLNAPMFDAKNCNTAASTDASGATAAPTANTHAADILAPSRDFLFTGGVFPDEVHNYMPFVANKPAFAQSTLTPRTFTCLTIGSRGDIQPYIALCLRLKQDGHKTVIVTHDEFKGWIEGYGIEHRQAGGDPTALMKLSTEHKMFSPGFFKESLGSFRQWLDDLLLDAWNACKDADVLIESPSTMAGVHIAEALQIPYFRAFTMPWTRTSAYPHAFMVPAFEMGPSFNYSTYVLFDNIMWQATSGQINRWRKRHLHLKATDMSLLSITKIPFLYNFSPAVVPKPLDWHDDIFITGYWNLANSDMEWTPPDSLQAFMDKAAADHKPLVYIGFGSIVVPHPNAMTRSIIKAVEKSGVRAIIAKGWSSRGASEGHHIKKGEEEVQFPDSCYSVDKIPHGWLFPKIQAAMHHGGAGTVGASLRAGLPTIIKPWFGDQFFWANRVTKLEVGLRVPSLRSDDIASALIKATTNRIMIEKAARIGELIRSEDGVENAVQAIRYNILRAGKDRKSL